MLREEDRLGWCGYITMLFYGVAVLVMTTRLKIPLFPPFDTVGVWLAVVLTLTVISIGTTGLKYERTCGVSG